LGFEILASQSPGAARSEYEYPQVFCRQKAKQRRSQNNIAQAILLEVNEPNYGQ
jgi:hypothetical protein